MADRDLVRILVAALVHTRHVLAGGDGKVIEMPACCEVGREGRCVTVGVRGRRGRGGGVQK